MLQYEEVVRGLNVKPDGSFRHTELSQENNYFHIVLEDLVGQFRGVPRNVVETVLGVPADEHEDVDHDADEDAQVVPDGPA